MDRGSGGNALSLFGGDGLNSWGLFPEDDGQLPPLFAEPTSSAGYPSQVSYETTSNMGVADQIFSSGFNPRRFPEAIQPPTNSPTMMAAANTLMRNGHHGYQPAHENGLSNGRFGGLVSNNAQVSNARRETAAYDQRDFATNTTNFFGNGSFDPYVHGPVTSMRNNSEPTGRAVFNDRMAMVHGHGLFNSSASDRKGLMAREDGPLLHFGSDGNFANSGFMPPPNLETEDHVTDKMLQRLDSFEAQPSAATTQPSSPIMEKPKRQPGASNGKTKLPVPVNGAPEAEDVAVTQKPKAAKRRKGKTGVKGEDAAVDDGEDWQEPKQRRGKRQKSTTANNSRGPRADQVRTQGRGSQSADRKSGRENLTDEQRRENHIASEQKRRNTIKEGYDELIEFVPGLKAGGFSRSASMTQAVDWLRELTNKNVVLKNQLSRLKEGVGSRVV